MFQMITSESNFPRISEFSHCSSRDYGFSLLHSTYSNEPNSPKDLIIIDTKSFLAKNHYTNRHCTYQRQEPYNKHNRTWPDSLKQVIGSGKKRNEQEPHYRYEEFNNSKF